MEWVRPIPNAPERSLHASGPIFSPNPRFWTHFGSFLMFLVQLEIRSWPNLAPNTQPGAPNPQPGLQVPALLSGPHSRTFSASVSPHVQEFQKIMSTQLTQHYFLHFQELHEILSTKNQTWHSWRSMQFLEMKKIMLGRLGQHYFLNFLEMRPKN